MKKQIPGQMSLFDFIDEPKPVDEWALPCDTCGHDIKGCCDYDYINNHDYCVLGDKWIPKAPEHVPPVHRYLRYGPHTLTPEVREETKRWIDAHGVPDWVDWLRDSLPCENCTWYDGEKCCDNGHTNHYEYKYLICDGFYQSIVERKPSTVGEGFPSGLKHEPIIYGIDVRGICDDPYCPQCGRGFWTESKRSEVDCERCPDCHILLDWTPWHRVNDEEAADNEQN